jgi:hypothetical protein
MKMNDQILDEAQKIFEPAHQTKTRARNQSEPIMTASRAYSASRAMRRLSDPSRNDSGFTRLTAPFDKIGIDPLGGDNIRIAASLVSV